MNSFILLLKKARAPKARRHVSTQGTQALGHSDVWALREFRHLGTQGTRALGYSRQLMQQTQKNNFSYLFQILELSVTKSIISDINGARKQKRDSSLIFFLSRFFLQALTIHRAAGKGGGGDYLLPSLTFPHAHKHLGNYSQFYI